jgi:hypothetical protein
MTGEKIIIPESVFDTRMVDELSAAEYENVNTGDTKKYTVFARITRVISLGTFEAENEDLACKMADRSTDWLDVLGFDDEDPKLYAEEEDKGGDEQ